MNPELYKKDPLARLLMDQLHLSPAMGAVAGCIVYLLLAYGLGVLLSLRYAGPDVGEIYEGPEVLASPIAFILFPAILWWFYLWQLTAIAKAIEAQERSRPAWSSETPSQLTSSEYATWLFNQPLWSVSTVIVALGIFIGWYHLVVLPDIADKGYCAWWYVLPIYRYVVFLPLVVIALYMLCVIILRQFFVILTLNKFFRRDGVEVHPLHPDGAGGLGAVGKLAITTALFGVGLGFWAAAYSSFLVSFFTTQVLVLTVLYWALYLILTPMLLLGPVWGAHLAMTKAKKEQLARTSRELDRCLAVAQTYEEGEVQQYNKQLHALWERHQFLQKHYPEWPFSMPSLRNFSITAALPLLSGLLSFLRDVFLN